MEISNFNIITFVFKILCGTTTLFMVGYWVYEFQKNEDVSQVQYITIQEMEEVFHPEMTICIFKPLLIHLKVPVQTFSHQLSTEVDPKMLSKLLTILNNIDHITSFYLIILI